MGPELYYWFASGLLWALAFAATTAPQLRRQDL